MPLITVRAEGIPKAQARLGRISDPQLRRTLGRATVAGARVLVPVMRSQAPRRTGFTAKEVRVQRARREDAPGAIVGPSRKVWYRHFPIGGTRRGVKPKPWVIRGAMMGWRAAIERFWAVLRGEVRR